MITLNALAEQIELDLTPLPGRDFPLERLDIILKIKQVLGSVVRQDLYDNIKFDGHHDVSFHYINTTKVPVKFDALYNYDYIDLESIPMALPGNRGVKEVSPLKNHSDPFMLINSGELGLMAGLIQDEVVCYAEYNRVIFAKCIRSKFREVLLKIVCVTPESLGVDDPFFLPEDVQAKALAMVKAMFQVNSVDKVNDSNPTA